MAVTVRTRVFYIPDSFDDDLNLGILTKRTHLYVFRKTGNFKEYVGETNDKIMTGYCNTLKCTGADHLASRLKETFDQHRSF